MSLVEWIKICPNGIVTDEVIAKAKALQQEQKIAKNSEPVPVQAEDEPVNPNVVNP